jgi:hypothetical protein
MITKYEKHIYNAFLSTSRSKQNLPYKTRKNFAKFEDTDKHICVKKLSSLFTNYKHIDVGDFFDAPYEIYSDGEDFDLKFYTTQKAIKTYTLYKQKQENADPDSEEQIKYTTDSIYFIYQFCKEKNIKLDRYLNYKSGAVNQFMIHLKENKINLYSLFGFKRFDRMIQANDQDLVTFMFPDFYTKVGKFRLKYYNSKKLKGICNEGVEFIKKSLSPTT